MPRYAIGSLTNDRDNISVLASERSFDQRVSIEIIEYESLLGITDTSLAQASWFMSHANMKARQIIVYMDGGGVKIEPGAMSYFQGNLQMVSGVTAGNLLGRALSGMLTGEKLAIPEYTGTGVLVLEPSFKFFCIFNMDPGESVIVDKGLFYVAQNTVEVKPVLNRRISAALLGGEGFFQTQLIGPGIVVFELPVPEEEIQVLHLENEMLKVDGNFAVLRTGSLDFTVERSSKTFIGSAISGEGLVNVFKGTGDVWLAPTLKVYQAVKLSLASGGDVTSIDMNTGNGDIKPTRERSR